MGCELDSCAEHKEIPALEGREGARGFLVCLF